MHATLSVHATVVSYVQYLLAQVACGYLFLYL